MNQRMDGFNVSDMDKKFPFQGQMNPKMQPGSVQNAMPQQQDMQQFSFFPQAVSMMSQAGIPQMQFSAATGMPNGNFRMAQNPSNLQQFPAQQQQQQANLMANMGMGNQGLVPQLSQAAQMTSPPSANSIISFPHLSQLQQSASSNKNIHDEVINASSGQNVDQSASSQDNNGNTPNGLANPQSPAPVSGNNAQVSSPNSGSGSNNNMSTAITPASPGVVRSLAPGGAKATYIDITPYLNMPQKEAARRLGIPTSTLSKRWKEAVRCRKWPYRTICKLDKEIMALLQNIPQDYNTRTNQLPEEIETTLGYLLRKRQEELQPVIIRV